MMLSNQTIRKLVETQEVSISPYNPDNVGPASYDLTLGSSLTEIRPVFMGVDMPMNPSALPPNMRNLPQGMVPIKRQVKVRTMDEEYPSHTFEIPEGKSALLPPKGFILATTAEYLKIPADYAVYVEGRSSLGRIGLQVQNAGFVDPGFEGQITLELFNASDVPIALQPGRRVCQITFIKLDEPTCKPYQGKYVGQTGATASRIEKDREVTK